MSFDRRHFIASSLMLAASSARVSEAKLVREKGVKLKIGLNGYSFDKPLRAGTMTLADAVAFCAQQGVDAIDPTGLLLPRLSECPSG